MGTNRMVLFVSLFVGFSAYMLCRKSLMFVMPVVARTQPTFSKQHLGMVVSAQNVAYSLSKFTLGVCSDRMDARRMFAIGLALCAASVLAAATTTSPTTLALAAFANGLAQGGGWPACAKLLRQHTAKAEFATYWSLLSASAHVVGALTPLFLSRIWFPLRPDDYRGFLQLVGVVSVGFVPLFVFLTATTEEDDSVEEEEPAVISNGQQRQDLRSFWVLIGYDFLRLISISYFAANAAKTAIEAWSELLLVEEKQVLDRDAAQFLSVYEMGSFLSCLLTGYFTDKLLAFSELGCMCFTTMQRSTSIPGTLSPRRLICGVYLILAAVAVYLLTTTDVYLSFYGVTLGFCLNGAINLLGVMAYESVPFEVGGSAHAVAALAANLGAVCSGLPLSWLASLSSWSTSFYAVEMMCGVSGLLVLVGRGHRRHVHRLATSLRLDSTAQRPLRRFTEPAMPYN